MHCSLLIYMYTALLIVRLIMLYITGELQLAWQQVESALLLDVPPRLNSNFHAYQCGLPVQVSSSTATDYCYCVAYLYCY
jgi:hypothetical protein